MHHEASAKHPKWEGAVAGLLFAVEWGLIDPNDIGITMSNICINLLRSGMLANLGEVQTYLRERNAPVQLIAAPPSRQR